MNTLKLLASFLFLCAVGAVASCGPSDETLLGEARDVTFTMGSGAESKISHLKFTATPTEGQFFGSSGGCEFSDEAGTKTSDDTLAVGSNGKLTVLKAIPAQPGGLEPNDVVVVCRLLGDSTGHNPTVDIEECKVNGTTSTKPDTECLVEGVTTGCGDGEINGDEECDEGTTGNGDKKPCLSDCVEATCGDGLLCDAADCDTGPYGDAEECDKGDKNGTSGGTCSDVCEIITN